MLDVQRLLRASFKGFELDFLLEQPRFQKAATQMASLNDFERILDLAELLLSQRDPRNALDERYG